MPWSVVTRYAQDIRIGDSVMYNNKYIMVSNIAKFGDPLGEDSRRIIVFVLKDGTTFGRNPDEFVSVLMAE